MALRPPGAERSDEEAVAEAAMDARRQVKIFGSAEGTYRLEHEINQWLLNNPNIEILEFFPVSVSTSVALAVAKAANEVKIMGGSDYPSAGNVEERSRESAAAAVGIYYLER